MGELVILSWEDIHTHHEWAATDAGLGLAQCKTVGWVIQVSRRSVTLAASLGVSDPGEESESTEHNLRQCIPWGCVTAVEVLKAVDSK